VSGLDNFRIVWRIAANAGVYSRREISSSWVPHRPWTTD